MKFPRDKTVWGVQGGDLKGRAQSHLAIGTALHGFYFTLAVRVFGHWARVRVYCRRPFLYLGYGNMQGDLFTEGGIIRRSREFHALRK